MYGTPNFKHPMPVLHANSPALIKHEGVVWLSSIGLAGVMGKPHSSLIAAIASLNVDSTWRAANYPKARAGIGVRATGLWISRKGFDVLALVLPREEGDHWRDVLRTAFEVVSQGTVPAVADDAPDEGRTAFGLNFLGRFLRRGDAPCT